MSKKYFDGVVVEPVKYLDIDKEFEPFRLTKKIVETLKPVKDQEYKAYRAQKTLEKTNDKNIGMGRS